LTLLKD
jgi:hypothetical protein